MGELSGKDEKKYRWTTGLKALVRAVLRTIPVWQTK